MYKIIQMINKIISFNNNINIDIFFITMYLCRIGNALIEMPGSLKCGKIIKWMPILPHFNKPLEKSLFDRLTFPHYNKAFFKRKINKILKIKKIPIRFAHIKKHFIPSTFFFFTTGSKFYKMSGRNQSDSVIAMLWIT